MRSQRALLNFTFSFTRNVIGTILSLVTTPFILKAIGDERFGAFRILMDWISHLGVLEFGLYSASLALISKAATEGPKSLQGTLRLIFKNYLYVFFIQLIIFIAFSIFINYLIPVSPHLQSELQTSALIMSLSLLFIISQVFKAYLEGTQKGYVVSVVLVVFNFTYILQATFYASIGWGLIGQATAYVISLFISLIALVYAAPEVLKTFFKFHVKENHQLLLKKQRWSHFVNELCGRISLLSDNIIISLFMGAESVTAFFITQKSGNLVQQQLQHLSNSSWAALSELHYQGKKEIFNQRVLNLTELIAYSSGVLLSVVCLLNQPFVNLWTGESTFSGIAVSNLTAINAGFFSIISLWSWCFSATNLTEKIVNVSIVHGLVNLVFSVFLTKWIGLTGPLYGTLIGYVGVSLFWKSSLLSKTFEINFLTLTKSWLIPLVPPLTCSMGYLFLGGRINASSWMSLFLWSFFLTLIFSLFGYLLLLTRPVKKIVLDSAFSVFNKIYKSKI
jgi:O-antigen/teichoic acid export membrane protein